jgi:hypothetical protein
VFIIDTSSIINLDDISLAGHDVLFYMRKFFEIHVCETIRDEVIRHHTLLKSQESSYWKGFLSMRKYIPSVLTDDRTAIGPFYSTPPSSFGSKDAGEHGNARVALELLITQEIGHAIFVTDDEKACNAFLKAMCCSFPGVSLWTSADVILYLGAVLLKESKADFDAVRAALRDVYAAGAKKWKKIAECEKSTIIRNQERSVASLRLVKKVIDHWRNSHV